MIDNNYPSEFEFSPGGRISSESISRPKSAAPQYSPLDTLNGSSGGGGTGSSSSFYNDLNALSIGSRRPASTGLIGQHMSHNNGSSSVMESLGLMTGATTNSTTSGGGGGGRKPRSIMDLIQEDFPKSQSQLSLNDVNDMKATSDPRRQHQEHQHPNQHQHHHHHQPSYHQTQHGTNHFVDSNPSPTRTNHNTNQHNHPQPQTPTNSYAPQYVNTMPQPVYEHHRPSHNNIENPMYSNTHQHHHPISPDTVEPPTIYTQGPHPPLPLQSNSMDSVPHHMIHVQSYDPTAAAQTYYNDGGGGAGSGGGGRGRRDPTTSANLNQPNRNTAPSTIYMNQPTFGGYTTIQYHHPQQGQTHPAYATMAPAVLHDPNLQARVLHPRDFVPVHTTAHDPHAAPIYYWPNGAPAGTPSTVTILDAAGRPTTVMAAPVPLTTATTASALSANPSYNINGTMDRRGKGSSSSKKGNDRSRRSNHRGGGRKMNGSKGTLDVSRHSGSSASESLLEEYKSSKGSWTTFDIEGHIVEFCQDQNGSRFIQQRLECADESEKLLVLREVLPSVRRLRNDVFGNYVVQKLLAHGTKEMRDQLKATFKNEMLSLSTQMYGCRVVQKALETLEKEDVFELLSEYHGHVLSCIHDQNGNHVIQKCVEVMSHKAGNALVHGNDDDFHAFNGGIQFIVDCVTDDIIPLSCHPYGCRVLQRMLEHCIPQIKTFTMDQLLGCHRTLLDDQYGNYVIQHVLQFGRDIDRLSILNIVIESGLLNMCRQKFASNVVEKLLKYGTNDHRTEIVREMLKTVEDTGQHGVSGSSVALLLVRDAYANYVVQTTLDVVPEGREKRLLIDELNNHADQLVCFPFIFVYVSCLFVAQFCFLFQRNFTFAKHIVTKLAEVNSA